MKQVDCSHSFVTYSTTDTKHAGADKVIKDEFKDLKKRRGTDPDDMKALALSGGGIRSASFCLGVLQSLARHNKLNQFDYLSTVSGGGYLGGALSWAWLNRWKQNTECNEEFGTDADNFPFGSGQRYTNQDATMDRKQAAMMRHLRQHGKYLTPGKGLTGLSFISVLIRSITMGLVTLLMLSSLAFHLLHAFTPVFNTGFITNTYALDASLGLFIVYILSLLLYGLFAIAHRSTARSAYIYRHRWEVSIKFVLQACIVVGFLALSEEIRLFLDAQIETAGGLSALFGALLAWKAQSAGKTSILSKLPAPLLMYVGLIIFFMGLAVLSNHIAYLIQSDGYTSILIHALLSLVVLVSAILIPINRVSIHRYYRDRLMETFMPDICRLFDTEGSKDNMAMQANEAALHDCMPGQTNKMPYHIINTNIILVESEIQKFRGRCGDNFILSPLYSGSNATGWTRTECFAGGSITLPTAVAISGAAANSDSGVAGSGLTVNPFVSAIMSIFNLRLGYWTVNPDTSIQKNQSITPNYFRPGFRGVLSRKQLNEKADFIQLSDGGHFENLALYEMLRRRCKLIICCDAEQDQDFVFQSLSNIIEKARVDFGVEISIDSDQLNKLRYTLADDGSLIAAEAGYIVSYIYYPDNQTGTLIYIKSTLPDRLPADVMGYFKTHPTFPHETTVDQFFDEKQMEAYRMLGMTIAEKMIEDKSIDL